MGNLKHWNIILITEQVLSLLILGIIDMHLPAREGLERATRVTHPFISSVIPLCTVKVGNLHTVLLPVPTVISNQRQLLGVGGQ